MMLLVIPAAPRIIPNAHGTSPVCETVNELIYAPRADIHLWVYYQTCGILNPNGTWFVSTSHNVTFYCKGLTGQACAEDFQLNKGSVVLLGQNNTVTRYRISNVQYSNSSYENLTTTTNQNQVVDFAQTYFQLNITDRYPSGAGRCFTQFCVWTRAQFIGTSNSFELDWADGNNDGVINNTDLNNVSAEYGKPNRYWDFDRSGAVDATDIARVAIHGGRSFGIPNYPGQGCVANSVESSNSTACPPLLVIPPSPGYFSANKPRQGWKDLCGIFPDPDKTYCNYLPG